MPGIYVTLYDIFILLYRLAILVSYPFSARSRRWYDGRAKLFARLRTNMKSLHGKKIWVHCASLGEFEQARPLIEMIKERDPAVRILLTFFSPSGYDVRRYYEGVDYVSYMPIDNLANAVKFIRTVRPELIIWVKYEYWYHFLRQLYIRQLPIVLVSAVFRADQPFFRWYGGLHREMLGYFRHIFVQNEESRQLLRSIGFDGEVCADTRFDRVASIAARRKDYDTIAAFKGDKKLIVAGSTWKKDIDLIARLINEDPFQQAFKYVIAPHDVNEENNYYIIERITASRGLFSRVTTRDAHEFDVLIIDGIGMLSSIYYYADVVYVGGGFGASVHNILEPAVYGKPVIFGPHYQKSAEAVELLSHPDWHAAHTIRSYDQLLEVIEDLYDNNEAHLRTGSEKTREYVLSHTGGTEQIYAWLKSKNCI
ncbi:MAG: 3-deoxy-D-manno-octulosonic acid transferase [Bacteroidetes bacterium]|nr:3-deoxy-D-manno-octulosonic acid transferase [Bacteroidota bacterium]